GLGAAVALPLLDAMVPAMATVRDAVTKPAARLGFICIPNGAIMEKWIPVTEGAGFEITPILQPLAPFRDSLLVLSGLDDNPAHRLPGEPPAEHSRGGCTFLTGVHPKKTEGTDARAGISVDQVAAKELGEHTQ